MFKLIKYLKPYTFQILVIVLFTFIQVYSSLQLPDYMANIVNNGIVQEDQALILNTGLQMLIIALIGGVATIISGYLSAKMSTAFARDLRERVFAKVESFSLVEFNKFSTSSLITRSTNDIQQVQTVLSMVMRFLLYAPILGVGAILKAYAEAPSMTWIMAVSVVSLVTVIIAIFSFVIPKFEILQKLVDKLNLVARENLTGLRVIRAFNTEKFEEERFDNVNQELTGLNLLINRVMAFMQPAMILILNLTTIGIIWVGAHLIGTGNLEIGQMIAFMQYAVQVIFAFLFISIVFIMIPRASVSARRIGEVLEVEPKIVDPETPTQPRKNEGVIEFQNVCFSYENADTYVLDHISFEARPGETTAIIGSTGSGKSTLVNLIPRFYDINQGKILIDGVDIREMNQHDLHEKIGYVSQKAVLFSGSVESNIKYGRPEASMQEIINSAEVAQATEFINKLENKYAANVSQGGTNLSGGQKQRLSIARALIKNPEIYIFDDSFSALDFKTDMLLREALAQKIKVNKATVLIVAQRISTIINAEKIIVLDEGKIVGIGTHEQLMKSSKVYKEIATSQLSEKELNDHKKEVTL